MIVVRLFAGMAEVYGNPTLTVDCDGPMAVRGLKERIATLSPALAPHLASALVAVNRAYADDDAFVRPGDEIGLIPPVGGGADGPDMLCRVIDTPLDLGQAFALLSHPNYGGTVVFSGTVREWTRERQTSHLEYEAYVDMAIQQMNSIRADIESAFPGMLTLCWHRIGRLMPTEVAVVCGAAAPHRDDAFVAARMLIDRVKKEVPIWKKEFFADGASSWQPNP